MVGWTEDEVNHLKLNYSTSPREELVDELSRDWTAVRKKAERIGLSRHSQYLLIKSIREAPEPHFPDRDLNNYIVGLVDGEGTFTSKNNNGRPEQHRFGIQLVEDDRGILETIHEYLGVGHISTYDSDIEEHKPTVTYNVQNFGELVCVIIPFFDEYELRARKRMQYERWASSVLSRPNFRIEKFK